MIIIILLPSTLAGRLAHAVVEIVQRELVPACKPVSMIVRQIQIVAHSVGMTDIAGCLVATRQRFGIPKQTIRSSIILNAIQGISELSVAPSQLVFQLQFTHLRRETMGSNRLPSIS